MADEIRVTVARHSFGYRGETYREGDKLEVSQSVVDNHPNTLEIIESGSESDDSEDESEGESDTDDEEICGVEMSDGDICERPADSCPYHG